MRGLAPTETTMVSASISSKSVPSSPFEVETITGTYTNPGHVMAYDDGEVRQQFSIAFRASLIGGEKRTSDESSEVEWLTPDEISRLNLHPSMRLRLAHALEEASRPHIG